MAATTSSGCSPGASATALRTASCDFSRISSTRCSDALKFVALASAWLTSSSDDSFRISPLGRPLPGRR
jgi:hypothetical protein